MSLSLPAERLRARTSTASIFPLLLRLLLILLSVGTGAAFGAPAYRQGNYAVPQKPQTSVTVNYNSAQLAGSLNVVIVGWAGTAVLVNSVTDTRGNVYQLAVGPTLIPNAAAQSIYYAKNIVAGTNSVTVSFSAPTDYPDIRILEYTGIDTVDPVDVVQAASGTSATSDSGAVTTTNASDLIVAGNDVVTKTTGPGTGFTRRLLTAPDGDIAQDRIVSAVGSYSATAPLSSSGGWVMQLVAFRAAPIDTQAPTAPTNLTATPVSGTQINLGWTAATDNVGVTNYLIERCQGVACGSFSQIGTSATTAFNNTGLTVGTSYRYRVRATDAAGNLGPYSNVASATTLAPPVISSALSATGVVGTEFTYQITASNNPTSFAATGLPAGLSVNASTGLISGTPSAVSTSSVTLSATNGAGTGNATLALTINPPPPVIMSALSATGLAGTEFTYQITATNNPTSYGATGLPAGLSINTATGLISGTANAAGTSSVTLSATNGGGTGNATLTLAINPAVPVITSALSATGTVGIPFTYQITATNSPTSYGATGLPSGLSINAATGLISGTPDSVATSTVTLSATNVTGTGSATLTLTINPLAPVITSATSATGTVGVAFNYQITASNGPTSFNATGLPAGLSINTATGLISGTPGTAGASSVTLSATNAGGAGNATLTLTIHPPAPVITSATSATGTVGTAFSYQITSTNNPTSFGATGLPSGLSINTATGLISGTPDAVATSTVTLSATNGTGTGNATLTLTINPPAPVITSATSATGTVGAAFNYQITASNGPASFNATGLPSGLSINTTTGLISGTPDTAATSPVTLSATNPGGTGNATLTLTIHPPAPVISSATSATGTVGTAFSYQITAANSPTSFGATGLPSGLSINTATGLISGTPDSVATSTVTLSATNITGTGNATLTLTINPATPVITSATSATGTTGIVFNYQITATHSPTSFGATGLPSGLSINTTTGLISGTPDTTGTSFVTLSATNAGGTGNATLTLTISPPAPVITSATSATGTVGVAFNYQITASNGPTSFNATGLPSGLSINAATGLISGTPDTAGASSVMLSATNTGGAGNATLTLTIHPPAPVITSATSVTGTVGTAFSYQITATHNPTSFGATGLPSGLAINSATGLILGTPDAVATSMVTLSATNITGTGNATLTLTINPPAPVITSATSATGTVGVAFDYQITASNSPTSFNATGLPSGLSINAATGLISGTPGTAGASSVTLSATNAGGAGNATLTLTINPPAPVITSATSATGTVGTAFSYQITATNNPTSFGATGLPSGLVINSATGLISGTPDSVSTSIVTLSATNITGTGNATLTLTINPPVPVITSATSAAGTVGTAFNYQITASNSPTSFNATGLPSGLSINNATGLISGTPDTTATSPVTLSATNAGGAGNATLTLTIHPPAAVITSATSVTGTVGTAFSYQITATNNPTSFGATGLPSGLAINSATGFISGTPDAVATSTVILSATNGTGTGNATLTLTINPSAPVITSATSATGTVGIAFSYQITANHNPTSFGATGLPSGLSINPATGLISGTSDSVATSTVTLSATNITGTGNATLTLTINPPVPVITSATVATGTVGVAFNYQITASNGPTSFNATGLPSGLSINTATGLISGTPDTTATSPVTLSATNAGGTGNATLTLTINPPAPVITSVTSATGTVGIAFNYQITATNSPTSFNATGLPSGLSINSTTGVISGTPETAATSSVTLSAINAGGTGNATLTLTINLPAPVITSSLSAIGIVGQAFTYQVVATNNPTSYGATGLPSGLSINTMTGLISGTSSVAATSIVTLSAVNSGGTTSQTLTLTIGAVPTVTINQGGAQGDPTNSSTINFNVVFSTSVTGFTSSGVALGGTAGATTAVVTGSGATYNVAVSGMTAQGTVTASVAAGAATDALETPSAASTSADNTVTFDSLPPTLTIEQATAQADPTNAQAVNFTAVFNESVTGFNGSSVTLSGTAGPTTATVSGGPTTYNVAVSGMTSPGTIVVSVGAGKANDLAGNANAASTSIDGTVAFDNVTPAATINQAAGQADPTTTPTVNFTVTFSEAVAGFTNADITLGGTAGPTTATVSGGQISYNVAVSGMTTTGTVIASIAPGAATDTAGNPNTASTSTDNTVTFDNGAPTVTVNQTTGQSDPTNATSINFTAVFSEAVTGFGAASVTLGGTAGATTAIVTGTGPTYNVAVSGMTTPGTVTASIAAGAVTDMAGNPNTASTSTDNTVTFDNVAPTAPSNLTATPFSSAQINLSWTASTDAGNPITYHVERCQGAGCSNFVEITTLTGTSFNNTGLTASTSYSYRVLATDPANNASAYSNTATATTTAGTVATPAYVQGNYSVPQTPQAIVVVPYTQAQSAGNLNVVIVGWAGNSVTINSVTDSKGNAYQLAVGPTIRAGVAAQSIYYAMNIAGAAAGTNLVTVTFSAPADYPDIRVAEYSGIDRTNPMDVSRGASGTNNSSNSGAITTTNANDLLVGANDVSSSTVGPGTGFTQRFITNPDGDIVQDRVVTATGSYSSVAPLSGSGGWVMQIVAFKAGVGLPPPDTTPPTAPGALTVVTVSNSQLNLSWTASTDDVGVTGYRVERCTGASCSSFAQIGTTTLTAFSDTNLAAGTTYSYRVRASDAALNLGPYSAVASGMTIPPPPVITSSTSALGTAGSAFTYQIVATNSPTSYGATGLPANLTLNTQTGLISGMPSATGTSTISLSATNSGGTGNATLTLTVTSEPFVTINQAPSQTDPTNASPINFAVVFSTSVTGFTSAGVTLGGTAGATTATVTGSGTTYNVAVSGMTSPGTVTASVIAGAATDSGGHANTASTSTDNTVTFDNVAPTVTLSQAASQADPTNSSAINFTVVFSEAVTGFTAADVAITGSAPGTKTATLSGGPATYNVAINGMTGAGTVAISVGANTVTDLAGNPNTASTTTDDTVTFDNISPTAPSALTATAIGNSQIDLAWTASSDPTSATITYHVERCAGTGCTNFAEIAAPLNTVLSNTSLASSTTYRYRVRASDPANNLSGYSNIATATTAAATPVQVGQWAAPFTWPNIAIHASLMPNGKVLSWEDENVSPAAHVWDPVTSVFTAVPYNSINLFCSGHTVLPDGRIMVAGGHIANYTGTNSLTLFNPNTQTWSAGPNMTYARWYPTVTGLPDGRQLVTSGAMNCQGCNANTPEIYNPVTNTWTQLTGATINLPLYPHVFVIPDGRVLVTGNYEQPDVARVLDLQTLTWTVVDPNIYDAGSAVQYLPGKILKTGTSGNGSGTNLPAVANSYLLDMTQPSPAWRQVASMNYPRIYHTLTSLPDGTILVTGGQSISNPYDVSSGVLPAEIWSPITEQWMPVASAQIPRVYHSTALLLPDGRVLVAGSGAYGSGSIDQYNGEIYSPPYLFKGARPAINSAPATLQYSQPFTLQTPDAAGIVSVVMIELGSVTHAFNENQRYIPVSFTAGNGSLTVNGPSNANVAPAGQYMLFIVNSNGVPSVASMLGIAATSGGNPPTAPSNLTGTVSTGQVILNWSPSTSPAGIANYNVYRSTTPGFTPSAANRLARPTTNTYTDFSFTASDTYYYLVTAQDPLANESAPSNELVATVITDVTPPTVSITAPGNGATVSGGVLLSANASDDVAVSGVQFQVDGTNIGSPITAPPYSIVWSSQSVLNGAHTITAIATDGASHATTSIGVSVNVNNTGVSQIRFIQSNYAVPQTPQSVVTVSFNGAQSAGNLNVVIVGWSNSTSVINSVTDSKGNAYVLAIGPTSINGVQSQAIYYAKNITSAANGQNIVSVNFNQSVPYPDVRILEYSGIDPANPLDVTAAATGNGVTSAAGPVTTTNPDDLIVGANYVTSTTASAGAGFTSRMITSPDGDIVEDRIVSSIGSYTANANLTATAWWVMQLVAFRAAGSAPGGPGQ